MNQLWDLRLGDWRTALADVKKCDAVICDPPYSARTHGGQRSSAESGSSAIDYAAIDYAAIDYAAQWMASLDPHWFVIFSDDINRPLWAGALERLGLYVFAPVGWVKPCSPRFAGDGPCSSVEWITVARPKRRLRDPGSRPGKYMVGRGDGSIVGQKDLEGMRALVRDYSMPGDLIVDPFAGSATTLLAASIEGRSSIGAEVRHKVHAMATARLMAGHTPTLF